MIKESELVKKLRIELKKLLPGCVVQKLNDKSSAGIPDLSVTHDDRQLWIETKVIRNYSTRTAFKKDIKALQLGTCCLLERAGRCFYVMLFDQTSVLVVRPSVVYVALNKPWSQFEFFSDIKFRSVFCGPLEQAAEFLCETMKGPK